MFIKSFHQLHREYSDLESSTQALIESALDRDLQVEIIDRQKCIIRLTKGERREIIQQGTITSANSHVVSQLLDNKTVTKRLLASSGIRVPEGSEYHDIEAVRVAFQRYGDRAMVVKPKLLSGGKGITFLPADSPLAAWQEGFKKAFQGDRAILVEEQLPGKDYRFLVIDFKTVAVVHRLPANAIGDGIHTVKQLVQLKNADPRRGKENDTPLCPLPLDELALSELNIQGLNPESIPGPGQMVYLRKTANISSGGDSIDYTDLMHQGYKQIAEKSAQVLDARITGVDILIANPTAPPARNNWGVIELNKNPALAIHAYPYQGKGRKVAESVLSMLGF